MTPYEILERFQKNHPGIVTLMRSTNHNFSPKDLNPYHLEGDVWTHTMMVFNYAVTANFPVEVQLAALLHDIGKAYTLKTREKPDGQIYTSFFGHDGVSYYRSLYILKESYSDVLTNEQIYLVARLVANHSVLYSWQNSDTGPSKDDWVKEAFAGEAAFLTLLTMLVESDALGRIALNPSDVSEYRKYRDFTTYQEKQIEECQPTLTVLVGPPCSGKSTYIDEYSTDEVIISSDNIIEEIGIGNNYNERFCNVDFKEVEKIMMTRFNDAVKSHKDIIIDRTNMSKKSRRRFANSCKGYFKTAVVFTTSHNEMIIRDATRSKLGGKSIPDYVFHNMETAFSYPLTNEFDYVSEYAD